MDWLKDLFSRLFVHYQSTLTGLAVIVITWLSDHGINLSEGNSKVLTAKLLALGIGLVKLVSQDKGNVGGGSSGGTGVGLRTRFAGIALISLLALTSACWFKGKPLQHQLAIATANATTALGGEVESIEVFRKNQRLSDDAAKGVQEINKRVNEGIATVRARARAGYEKKELLTIISATSDDLARAEQAGLIKFKLPQDAQLFKDAVSVAKFTIDTIRELVELGKTPPPPPAAKSLTEEITALVGIARSVAFDMWRQGRMGPDEAFADGAARTDALRDRLTELTQ